MWRKIESEINLLKMGSRGGSFRPRGLMIYGMSLVKKSVSSSSSPPDIELQAR